MKIQGFVLIKKDADFSDSIWQHYNLPGRIFAVLHFGTIEGTMIFVPGFNINARIAQRHINSQFECEDVSGFLVPPALTEFEKTSYIARIGEYMQEYNELVRQMIINDSLKAGKYTDTALFGETILEK